MSKIHKTTREASKIDLTVTKVFLGGAVLADIMKNNLPWWVTKKEYEEQGIRCIDKLMGRA